MKEIKRTVSEFVLVALAALAIGLAANAARSKGLKIRHNYFPARTPVERVPQTGPAGATKPARNTDAVADRLRAEGLGVIGHDQVVRLFEDPNYGDGSTIFVDARNGEQYAEGHIPQALLLNHYYLDDHLDEVLPYCDGALKIVVYCGGGECEDSELVALDLRDQGIDSARIFVYPGGIKAWKKHRMPVELGERLSEVILEGEYE